MSQLMRAVVWSFLVVLAVVSPAAGQTAPAVSAGDGTLYLGAFPQRIFVIDEASARVVQEIDVPRGAPRSMVLSEDRSRFYMLDPLMEHVTTVSVAGREVTDSFTLSEGNRRVRIRSFRVAPDGRTAILHVDAAVKLVDRFEIEPRKLLQYDLERHEVVKDIPWPNTDAIGIGDLVGSRMLFAPDGESLYYFDQDVLVLETENFTVVDRWDLSEPIEDGLGPLQFGFATDLINEEPGFFTGLFRMRDAAQNRDLMGVARIDLANRGVDFYALGPSEPVGFALAPGRRKAYGVRSEIGSYEFWTFDLEKRALGRRQRVDGRPRMALDVSSNGRVLYISSAGNTIDYYDADSFDYLHTLTLDGDMTASLFVLPPTQ